jgi:FSR family fosmidomycin resistance protein-like MFS transporter
MSAENQHKTRALWLVGILHAFTHIYHVALLPLYLLMQRDFGFANVGQATALVTIMMVAYFLPSYFLGVLADRMSRKKLLGWGLFINAAGFVGLALAPTYAWALVAVIVAGVGGSCFHPAATAMIVRLFPNQAGRALGFIGMGASVGFFIGPIYAGWRAGALEPVLGAAAWRRPILEFGLLGIAVAGLFAWLATDDKIVTPVKTETQPKQTMFPTAALWACFIASAFAFCLRDFAGTSMGSLGSLFLQQAHGYSIGLTGVVLSCIFLSSAISNPLFGHFSDRGRKRWTAAVLLIAAGLIAAFPHVPAGGAIPTLLLYGFFFMASYPMIEAMLMESVPDAVRGRVFGLFITIGGLIGNLSHWLAGDAVRRLGQRAATVEGYVPLYYGLAGMVVLSLLGLVGLNALRNRENLEGHQ